MKLKTVLTGSQMKNRDRDTMEKKKMPSCVLMERAALATAEEIRKRLSREDKILAVCGGGNNGGDGIAVARILYLWGYASSVYFCGNPEKMTDETKSQMEIARNYQVPIVNNPQWDEYTTIVDAIFGIGLVRCVEGRYADIIHKINACKAWVAAVDIPSGVCADTGKILGCAVQADLTVTFGFWKRGLLLYPGAAAAKETVVKDIGIYEERAEEETVYLIEEKDFNKMPARDPQGNKGTFGKVLIAAGSDHMAGAAYLSAKACMKMGVGMVKIHTSPTNRIILQTLLPEALFSSAESETEQEEVLEKELDWCDTVIAGPGIGTGKKSENMMGYLLKNCRKPMVMDADALNLLSVHPEWKQYLKPSCILTPHMGEMSRLVGREICDLKENVIEEARDYAVKNHTNCVLKDARTVIGTSKGETFLNANGNSGMATAGSGDVLSGIIGGLLGLGIPSERAAVLGPWIHGLAGDKAAARMGEYSMMASDIIDELPKILSGKEGV